MATITSLIERLNSIEQEFKLLKTENQKLKDQTLIKDTRHTNEEPEYYRKLGMGTYKEFKKSDVMGIKQLKGEYGSYSVLETTVPWIDVSGGRIKQIIIGINIYYRYGNYGDKNGWTDWEKLN
jgi:hypothetical protein